MLVACLEHDIALAPEDVATVVRQTCIAEIAAFKPGNVSVYSDGHGMQARDFVVSAEAAAAPLARAGLGVGQRIFAAVKATRAALECNTNLGIVLLAAPLVHAAITPGSGTDLRQRLLRVLDSLGVSDAQHAYRAIRLAQPGGLGTSERHDVRNEPRVSLLEAMRHAEDRDRIAFQYANGYEDIFEFAIPRLREARARWNSEEWATVATYVGLLARFTDSHVMRKFGPPTAQALSRDAASMDACLMACREPRTCMDELTRWDERLKDRGINPGTSADLTVAALLASRLGEMLVGATEGGGQEE